MRAAFCSQTILQPLNARILCWNPWRLHVRLADSLWNDSLRKYAMRDAATVATYAAYRQGLAQVLVALIY
jgi:hypothetical protein